MGLEMLAVGNVDRRNRAQRVGDAAPRRVSNQDGLHQARVNPCLLEKPCQINVGAVAQVFLAHYRSELLGFGQTAHSVFFEGARQLAGRLHRGIDRLAPVVAERKIDGNPPRCDQQQRECKHAPAQRVHGTQLVAQLHHPRRLCFKCRRRERLSRHPAQAPRQSC